MPQTPRISAVDTAKLVRAELKKFFPSITFSVRTHHGSTIDVEWRDGPTNAEVEAVAGRFHGEDWDGMTETSTFLNDKHPVTGELVHYGNRFISFNRTYSPDFMQVCAQDLAQRFGVPMPAIKVSEYDGSAHVEQNYDPEIVRRLGDTFSTVLWREMRTISALTKKPKAEPVADGVQAEKHEDGWHVTGNTYPHRTLFREVGATSVKGEDRKHTHWLITADELPEQIAALLEQVGETTTTSTPAAKFRALADGMQKQIDEKRRPRDWRPTARRANMDESREADARHLEKVQDKLRALATAWDDNTIPKSLQGVTNRGQVEYLLIHHGPPAASNKAFKTMLSAGLIDKTRFWDAKRDLQDMGNQQAGQLTDADKIRAIERDLIGRKIEGFFPTPDDVVQILLDAADLVEGVKVLEPSAGKGNIADALRDRGFSVDTVEISFTLRDILKLKGHNVIAQDFLEDEIEGRYDRIVMNPPFEDLVDIDHVRRAYDLLDDGGVLVSVMSQSPFFRTDRKAQDFRAWFYDQVWGAKFDLPEGSFLKSDRSTGVSTCYIVLTKPEVEKAEPVEPEPVAGVPDSWHAIPLLQPVIDHYEGMKVVTVLHEGSSLIIDYRGTWYIIGDNGGEITIQKINDPAYFREFPTMWFMTSLNTETLMYRLRATLDGSPIDYDHREDVFLHLVKA